MGNLNPRPISLSDASSKSFGKDDLLKLDDTFRFSCKSCGRCCRNRDDINLTGYDVYRIAKYFGKSNDEIITQYCSIFQSQMLLPSAALKMRAGTCPFLRNKKCSVQQSKPGVCRCYPLGRMFLPGDQSASFIRGAAGCNYTPHEILVRDWVGEFALEEAERIGSLWSSTSSCISTTLYKSEAYTDLSESDKQLVLHAIFLELYIDYNIREDFYLQLEGNAAHLRKVLHELYNIDIVSATEFQKGFDLDASGGGLHFTIADGNIK